MSEALIDKIQYTIPVQDRVRFMLMRAVLNSKETVGVLSSRIGVNPKTFSKWLLSDNDLTLDQVSDCLCSMGMEASLGFCHCLLVGSPVAISGAPPMASDLREIVARAIEDAQCPGREGPFGLYQYKSYSGDVARHVVRDFRDQASDRYGSAVFATFNVVEAREKYEALTRNHVADAALSAIKAMPDECLDRAAKVAFQVGGFGDVEWSTIDEFNRNLWRENARAIITAALSDSEAP